jgi:membrane associated rhomboid family serine protease
MLGPLSQIVRARRVLVFSLLLLAIHGIVESHGGYQQIADWFLLFGLSNDRFLHGAVWQLFTYALLHGSWFHLLSNILLLLLMGSRVEHMLGRAVLSKILAWGIVASGISHLLIGAGGANPLVGISGGCMALLILVTTISPDSRMLPLPLRAGNLGIGVMISSLLLALFNPALGCPGFSSVGSWLSSFMGNDLFAVGHACHFGGCLAGFLYGRWLLRPRITREKLLALRRE